MPRIAVMNQSSVVTDAQIRRWIPAFRTQWNRDLTAIWGVDPVKMTFHPDNKPPPSGAWWLVFLDDATQAGTLGFHDLTSEGLPLSKVFARSTIKDNASVTVAATHELCEMAVDPWLNGAYQDRKGVFWASEICDPVEDDQYGYRIDGVLVTDFVTPNWFGHQRSQANMDFRGHARKAFQILSGGYAQSFNTRHGWVQTTGAKAKRSEMAAHPAHGSRRDRRSRLWQGKLQPSTGKWRKR